MRYMICWNGQQIRWTFDMEEARNNFQSLERNVNETIKNGWRPLGGVAIVHTDTDDYVYQFLAQAMIRED